MMWTILMISMLMMTMMVVMIVLSMITVIMTMMMMMMMMMAMAMIVMATIVIFAARTQNQEKNNRNISPARTIPGGTRPLTGNIHIHDSKKLMVLP